MSEKIRCRQCFQQQTRGSGGRRPFALTGAIPHYAPDLPFKLEHVTLDLEIDPKAKTLSGTATQRVRTVAPDQGWIRLDQIGLTVDEVSVAGATSEFRYDGNSVSVRLPQAPSVGEVFEFSIRYHAKSPRRGLYFTGPDADHPKKPHQVWSQGQDEDSRYWFPSFDYPNQKATSEVIARVPKGFTAVSNGALLSKKEEGAFVRFHYKLGTPHVMYLVTLAVAEFSEWEDAGPGGVPVQYFVAPGREADGKRAFGNTPAMIDVFARKTGVAYPYEKYSQVAVQDFIFGGMENTSATTQTDLTLHDERAHLDFTSDPLVSHELAHQWFGDLLTCRDWSHGWLNEGFATFMERVWVENKAGEGGGLDEGKYYSYQDLKEYLHEDTMKYRRSIVCNTYMEPIDLFDTHLYQKGGLVLNLIRYLLGEELFWKSVQAYVARHKGQSVETLDLIRAIEETTGRNLRRVFDEWVFGAGHPDFELSYQWRPAGSGDGGVAEVVIEQKQTSGHRTSQADGFTTHLFHLPVVVEFLLEGGKRVTHRVEIGEARERVFVAVPSKPLMVRFDPGHAIPKTLKFPRPKEMLLYQLAHDEDCMGRIEAARELIAVADAEAVAALSKALAGDRFWGVQAEVAGALSEIRSDEALGALIDGLRALSDAKGTSAGSRAKARRAVVRALGTFKGERAAEALKPFAESDPSYYVEADAIHAWASASLAPGASESQVAAVEKFLLKQLGKSSYREVIRAATLRALGDLPGVGRGERPKAVEALLEWSKREHENDARAAAVFALGRVARDAIPSERARAMEALGHLAEEDNFRLRMAMIPALETAGGSDASFLLWKLRQLDLDGRVRRGAQATMDAVNASMANPEAMVQLRGAYEKLEGEYRKLRALVEETRAGVTPSK